MSSTKGLLFFPDNDNIWILWDMPCGSTWHPGSCLKETDMSSSSSPSHSQWLSDNRGPVCIAFHQDDSHQRSGNCSALVGVPSPDPPLRDPRHAFNHHQLLLLWMLFSTECFSMWILILSPTAVIQGGRKASKSLLLIGFQLGSNQFVLQYTGCTFNSYILPDTRDMEVFLLLLWHLCWKVLWQLCKGKKNVRVICRKTVEKKATMQNKNQLAELHNIRYHAGESHN